MPLQCALPQKKIQTVTHMKIFGDLVKKKKKNEKQHLLSTSANPYSECLGMERDFGDMTFGFPKKRDDLSEIFLTNKSFRL